MNIKDQTIKIDGARGEGGGQVFRTSLSLSMCTGRPLHIKNIRAGRSKPGLLRQHLACLHAARDICGAEVHGDELRSQEVIFIPGNITCGKYHFAVGSAGSTTLIFQTILPALLQAEGESIVSFEGGTHNPMAPSLDFIQHCFLPSVKVCGIEVDVQVERYGFNPSGGGVWTAKIHPQREAQPLCLVQRGELLSRTAVASSSKIPEHVAERETQRVVKKCQWLPTETERKNVDAVGPGNIISLRLVFENVQECFEVLGEKGFTAERVAGKAIKQMNYYLHTDACVAEHLADQLLLPMVLAEGGEFRTFEPSLHTRTNIEVINEILGVSFVCEAQSELTWRIALKK